MPQAILPFIPPGTSPITDVLHVAREGDTWYYFCGIHPVFQHPEHDRRSFGMFTSQLVCQGQCKQVDLVRALGVSASSVKRQVKRFREGGAGAFYGPRRGRGGSVLTPEVTARAQELLDAGPSRREVAEELGIKLDTLRKAITQGRVREPTRASPPPAGASTTKSERSARDADAAAGMGTACTRPVERALAAVGQLDGAPMRFEASQDVSFGGVLCALPALASNGLFRHQQDCFKLACGYYTVLQVITLLAYMALARIKTVEQLRYHPPGELGKLLGLDRVPEVRCLREKLKELCQDEAPDQWAGLLSQEWMEDDPDRAGTLYVDGHVRVYHGRLTKLPRRYVSRDRLCLRGTTDYWVNDAVGQPFFVVSRTVDEGLLKTLREHVVPRLVEEVPHQPSHEELAADPLLHRFIIVFDRAGYSPAFFREMWQTHRIACMTYHKYPGEAWPEPEFQQQQVRMPNGECVTMKLAERGTWLGDRATGLWVREVRKLGKGGHQTSVVSSAYRHDLMEDAGQMLSRWAQENFFGYMMEHFGIDLLSEYGTTEIPDPQPVVNPKWRELDSRCRSVKGQLDRCLQEFAARTLEGKPDPKKYEEWAQRKAELRVRIEHLEGELDEVKKTRKDTPKHIPLKDLPPDQQFQQLAPSRKRLLDTVKMIAYRAETAMAAVLRPHLGHPDEARSLLRDLYRSEADLRPDPDQHLLYVDVHHMANPQANRAIEEVLKVLNEAEFVYPGTDMRLVYSLAHSP